MALPIYATPTLTGKDADRFMEKFETTQKTIAQKQCASLHSVPTAKVRENIKKLLNGKK